MEESLSIVLSEKFSLGIEDQIICEQLELTENDITFWDATSNLIKTGIPSCFALIFQILLEVINITFVGNLNDTKAMATVGLSSLTINALLFGPGYGICGGIDTLVATAYGGGQFYLCGVYLNRGRLIQLVIVTPFAILLALCGEDLYGLIGQDEEIARMTQQFLLIVLPGAFCALQFQITKRFMLAQKIFYPIVYFQIFLLIEHFIVKIAKNYCFIYVFEFGYIGAAISHSITNFIAAVGLTLALIFIKGIVQPESFHFFNKDSFTGWKEYCRYGVPSMMITTLQWASFECMGVFSGILGVTQLSAQTALANLHSMEHMIPLGTSFGSGACVGNSLGRGDYKIAHKYTIASYYISWIEGLVEATILFFFGSYIFRLYTQNEEILSLMNGALYAMMFNEVNSCLLGVLKGLIKAMGRQTELAKWCILINVILSNGFIVLFCFVFDFGLSGIWIGLSLASAIGNAYFSYRVVVADWKLETQNTLNRINEDRKKLKAIR